MPFFLSALCCLVGLQMQAPEELKVLHHPDSLVLEPWSPIAEVQLELPLPRSNTTYSQAFLGDGRLVLKYLIGPTIYLFGTDGSLEDSWQAPHADMVWNRSGAGDFIGGDLKFILFKPSRLGPDGVDGQALRLWNPSTQTENASLRVLYRQVTQSPKGFWARDGGDVIQLQQSLQPISLAKGDRVQGLLLQEPARFAVNEMGALAIAEGFTVPGVACSEPNGETGDSPFRIHLVSPSGNYVRTVRLQPPMDRQVRSIGYYGNRILLDTFDRFRTDFPRSLLYDIDLETLEWVGVVPDKGRSISFIGRRARILHSDRTVKVFRSDTLSVQTYAIPGR